MGEGRIHSHLFCIMCKDYIYVHAYSCVRVIEKNSVSSWNGDTSVTKGCEFFFVCADLGKDELLCVEIAYELQWQLWPLSTFFWMCKHLCILNVNVVTCIQSTGKNAEEYVVHILKVTSVYCVICCCYVVGARAETACAYHRKWWWVEISVLPCYWPHGLKHFTVKLKIFAPLIGTGWTLL